jgi:hypothetical protein
MGRSHPLEACRRTVPATDGLIMTPDKQSPQRRRTHSRFIVSILVGAVALAAAGAVLASVGTKHSDRKFTSKAVVDAFDSAGMSLMAEGRPSSKLLPVTFFSRATRGYVLVWPDAAARRHAEQANGPSQIPMTKLELSNVEVDLPAHSARASALAQSALNRLRSTGK